MSEIRISELDTLGSIVSSDFFPLVESSSMTTFKVSITTLNDWMTISGSCLSASYAPFVQAYQPSGSWATSSIDSLRATQSLYATQSWYATQSIFATQSINATQSLYATQSINATQSLYATSASWASQSLSSSFSTSASYASQSYLAQNALTASYISASVNDTLPIGSVISVANNTVPNNYLECNGAAVLTSSYGDLWTAISSSNPSSSYGYLCDSYGNKDSSGYYFKLPDLRGEFLRGWDNGRGIDSSRSIGSFQSDSFKTHQHIVPRDNRTPASLDHINAGSESGGTPDNVGAADGGYPFKTLVNSDSGSTETRPRNIAIMYCIKYSAALNYGNLTGVTLAGDVVGNYTTTNVVAIQNIPVIGTVPPTANQVLTYDISLSAWKPQDVNLSVDSVYPRISRIAFTSSNDDYVNIDLTGMENRDTQSNLSAGYSNSGTYISRELIYDSSSLGLYVVKSSGATTGYIGMPPIQQCLIFADNRGGGSYYWRMTGSFIVDFALSSTTTRRYTYVTPGASTNYAGTKIRVLATRAKLGIDALINDDDAVGGTITSVFSSYSITTL